MSNSPPRRPFHRRFWFYGPLVLAVLLAAFLVEERVRGERALARWKAEMIAKGERFSFQELLRPGLEFDQNAASYFLETMASWKNVNLSSAGQWQYVEPEILSAAMDAETWPLSNQRLIRWKAFVEKLKPAQQTLDEVNRILRGGRVYARLNYQNGFDLTLPFWDSMQTYWRVAPWLVVLDVRSGQVDRAFKSIRCILHLLDQEKDQPLLMIETERSKQLEKVYPVIWAGIEHGLFSSEQLGLLQADLARLNLLRDMANGLRVERAMGIGIFREIQSGQRALFDPDTTFQDDLNAKPPATSGLQTLWQIGEVAWDRLPATFRSHVHGPIWQFAWRSHDELSYMSLMQDRIDRCESAARGANAGMMFQESPASRGLTSWGHPQGRYDYCRFLITPLLHRGLEPGVNAALAQARIHLAVTACALHRYKLQHRDYPNELKELVPGLLPVEPMDPLEGKTLRYQRRGADRFVLYSVGRNQKDDGGDGRLLEGAFGGAVLSPTITLDLLWPMRTNLGAQLNP